MTPRKPYLPDATGSIHKWTRRDWGVCTVQAQLESQRWENEVDTISHLQPRSYPTEIHLQRKKIVFPQWSLIGDTSHDYR